MIQLDLIGIGTGNPDHLTRAAEAAMRLADLILLPRKADKAELIDREQRAVPRFIGWILASVVFVFTTSAVRCLIAIHKVEDIFRNRGRVVSLVLCVAFHPVYDVFDDRGQILDRFLARTRSLSVIPVRKRRLVIVISSF